MTKKERIAQLKKIKDSVEELLTLNALHSNTLHTQLSSIDRQLEDLGALPDVKKVTEQDRIYRNKIRSQILGKTHSSK